MPEQATTRTILRRAAAGCAAVLPLALACACGATSYGAATSGSAAAAAGSPSVRVSATTPAPAQPSPGAVPPGAGTPGTAPPGAAASAAAPASPAAPGATTGQTPGHGAPAAVTGAAPVALSTKHAAPTTAPTTGTAVPAPAPAVPAPAAPGKPAAPAPAAAKPAAPAPAAPQPVPDAPGSSIVYHTATAGGGGKTVALTFDDGPGPATDAILDLLQRYHAKATFCEIGPQATANPKAVQRILAEGHRLCDHTVHHPQPMHTLPQDQQVYEIDAAKDMILKAGGPGAEVSWFRAPGGDFTAQNRQIAVQAGLRPLGWTVDTRDWAKPGVAEIVATAQRELHPGGIILMHDGGGDRSETVAALSQLLPWLVEQGYTFDFPAG
ncbi:polysaccharide deacetylase family protein [Kitasatospora sp. HPMI-4]|uniref:polysaccharide deacetylase family protein n=1 Tax=Kitasatospora sp. HPMI-4 TaxID=3448443 RepID=UPI003F1A529E